MKGLSIYGLQKGLSSLRELRPRQYYESIKVRPRSEWKEAIENEVPERLRDWVRQYLNSYVEHLKAKKREDDKKIQNGLRGRSRYI